MKGSEFGELIKDRSGLARETTLRHAVANGQYPSVFGTIWKKVRIARVIAGRTRELVIDVAPDFFAVGTMADPFYIGGWTTTSQYVVDHFDSLLPSRALAREIARAATRKLTIYDSNPGEPWYDMKNGTPRNIEASGAFIAANKRRLAKLGPMSGGELVDGHMKNVITKAGGLSGSCPSKRCVTIYGGGGGSNDGWAVQPKSTVHGWDYGPDYSHGIRLVRRRALLDDEVVDLRDVFMDSALSVLVSDEGAFDPVLPDPGVAPSGGSSGGSGSGPVPVKGGGTIVPPPRRMGAAGIVGLAILGGVVFFASSALDR